MKKEASRKSRPAQRERQPRPSGAATHEDAIADEMWWVLNAAIVEKACEKFLENAAVDGEVNAATVAARRVSRSAMCAAVTASPEPVSLGVTNRTRIDPIAPRDGGAINLDLRRTGDSTMPR